MAILEELDLDGSENGGTAGAKINLSIVAINALQVVSDADTLRIDANEIAIDANAINIWNNAEQIAINVQDISDLETEQGSQNQRMNGVEAIATIGWRDNVQAFSASNGTVTTEPNWQDMGNGMFGYNFTAGEELFVSYHVDHDYAVGTDAYPHVHWLSDTVMGAGDAVVWECTYVQAKGHAQGESLTAATTSFQVTYTADGTEIAGEHLISECSDAQAFILAEVDALVLMKWKLISTTTAGAIYGIMADLHYQADALSTINKAPDFYTEVV